MNNKVVSEGSFGISNAGPSPIGWVVEAIIEGRMAWLIEPIPLENYTFTFDLEKAHVFERYEEARDCKSSVWCSVNSRGISSSMDVILFTDEYRAAIAADQQR